MKDHRCLEVSTGQYPLDTFRGRSSGLRPCSCGYYNQCLPRRRFGLFRVELVGPVLVHAVQSCCPAEIDRCGDYQCIAVPKVIQYRDEIVLQRTRPPSLACATTLAIPEIQLVEEMDAHFRILDRIGRFHGQRRCAPFAGRTRQYHAYHP